MSRTGSEHAIVSSKRSRRTTVSNASLHEMLSTHFLSSHLSSLFLTLDGNHHANRYAKNTDPTDSSLFKGNAYLPDQQTYRDYLSRTEVTKEVCFFLFHFLPRLNNSMQKSRCSFISAVNFQDRKKFLGNDETGLINVQCIHVYILASVNMFLGER